MRTMVRMMGLCAASVILCAAVNAATFNVNTTSDTVDANPGDGVCADAGGACSFRAALSEANALAGDDVINLGAVTYTQTLTSPNEDLNVGGDWDIIGNVTIIGVDPATTILQANAAAGAATERVLNVRSGTVTISNVTIRNGRFTGTMTAATRGAGIENLGSLTLNNVVVRDNQINSTTGNSIGAGIHNAGPALTLNNSVVTANANTRVSGGSAFGGGVSSIVTTSITFNDSSVSNNTATSLAGGFGFGAGVYIESLFTVNATNSHFDNNTGSGPSGTNGTGVRALSNVGAAVFNATNTTFNGNSGVGASPAAHQGVGLQLFSTTAAASLTATLNGVTINGNVGNTFGIGMNVQISNGSITANIFNSTISNNTGGSNGGGLHVTNGGATGTATGTINVVNSTVSGNIANGAGGGIRIEQPTAGLITANLNFATIANNRANNDNSGTESGGGISVGGGVLNLKNSIVADNSVGAGGTGPDIAGPVNSQDYNHVEDISGATITGSTANNVTGSDPQLGPLANNGGTTMTHLPGDGSPVLNSIPNGTNDCGTAITSDQRGTSRPQASGCEKGSVETASAVVNFDVGGRVSTASGNGIRNATVTLSGGGLAQPIVTVTGSFGYFLFPNVQGGQTYTLTVGAKRFTFTPTSRQIILNSDLTNENFVANP